MVYPFYVNRYTTKMLEKNIIKENHHPGSCWMISEWKKNTKESLINVRRLILNSLTFFSNFSFYFLFPFHFVHLFLNFDTCYLSCGCSKKKKTWDKSLAKDKLNKLEWETKRTSGHVEELLSHYFFFVSHFRFPSSILIWVDAFFTF